MKIAIAIGIGDGHQQIGMKTAIVGTRVPVLQALGNRRVGAAGESRVRRSRRRGGKKKESERGNGKRKLNEKKGRKRGKRRKGNARKSARKNVKKRKRGKGARKKGDRRRGKIRKKGTERKEMLETRKSRIRTVIRTVGIETETPATVEMRVGIIGTVGIIGIARTGIVIEAAEIGIAIAEIGPTVIKAERVNEIVETAIETGKAEMVNAHQLRPRIKAEMGSDPLKPARHRHLPRQDLRTQPDPAAVPQAKE
jgi:hypothetical protein